MKQRTLSKRHRLLRPPRMYVCPGCGHVCNPRLYEQLTRLEWVVSGLCKECQSEVFEGDVTLKNDIAQTHEERPCRAHTLREIDEGTEEVNE